MFNRYSIVLFAALISACVPLKPLEPAASTMPVAPIPSIVVQVITPTAPTVPKSPFIGKVIDTVISQYGPPMGVADMGNGIQAFQFKVNPKKANCVASYLASRENETKPWIIEEYIAPDSKTCQ